MGSSNLFHCLLKSKQFLDQNLVVVKISKDDNSAVTKVRKLYLFAGSFFDQIYSYEVSDIFENTSYCLKIFLENNEWIGL